MFKMLNNFDKQVSYFQISAGIGNALLNGGHLAIKSIQNSPIQNQNRQIHYIDTVNILLKSFSFSGSLKHNFDFYDLFPDNDGLRFTPGFLLNTGINVYKIKHNSSLSDFNAFTKKRLKKIRHFFTQSENQKWQIQSLGLDLDLNYVIGKFNFEPDLYLDDYLPKTTDRRFTQIYNFNIGMTF